jgi:hypothetical protein
VTDIENGHDLFLFLGVPLNTIVVVIVLGSIFRWIGTIGKVSAG